jgi:hypothetical protein
MSPKHPEGHDFYRKFMHDFPQITHAEGIYLIAPTAADSSRLRRAIVVNIGHGEERSSGLCWIQVSRVAYVHAEQFTDWRCWRSTRGPGRSHPMPDARILPP